MKKISIFKKIKLFFIYKKLVKDNYDVIVNGNNNFKIDYIQRIYTIVNIPEGDANYGLVVAEEHIKDYLNKADAFFNKLNFTELIGLYEITQLTDTSYLVVFGFAGFDTKRFFKNLIINTILLISGIISYSVFF